MCSIPLEVEALIELRHTYSYTFFCGFTVYLLVELTNIESSPMSFFTQGQVATSMNWRGRENQTLEPPVLLEFITWHSVRCTLSRFMRKFSIAAWKLKV